MAHRERQPQRLITRAQTARGIVVWAYAVSSTSVCRSPALMPMPSSHDRLHPLDAHAEAAWILRQVELLPQTLRLMLAANYGRDAGAAMLLTAWLLSECQSEAERALMPTAVAEYCGAGRLSERELAEASGLSRHVVTREYGRLCGRLYGYDDVAMQMLGTMFRERGWLGE